jgi:hypothetical protein
MAIFGKDIIGMILEMNQFHNPIRQAEYLRQSLATDKMRIGLFLGAGCPVSIKIEENGAKVPLIPDISGLTQTICDKMMACDDCKKYFSKVQSHFEKDEKKNPTVEDILSHIRSLEQVAGNDVVRGLRAKDLDALDQKICIEISNLMHKTLPDINSPYHKVASWIGAIPRATAVEIFTTNYDLLMEEALEEFRVPFFDGFSGSFRTFFDPHTMDEDDLPSRWVRLWKLHGSINWLLDSSGNISRGEKPESTQIRIIHPSHLKYEESRKMPYFAMIDRLRALFKLQCVLVTCGYSFQDQHINQILMEGIKSNPNSNIFALLYGNLENYPHAIALSSTHPNLSLLALDEAVIGTIRAPWIRLKEEDITSIPYTVDWIKTTDKKRDENMQAQFNLGDFANFGEFLRAMIGEQSQIKEAT